MKAIAIPIEFFKAIGEKPPVIRIIWVKWLAEHTHDILEPDFCERFCLEMKDKNLNLKTIKEAYEFGIGFFEDGFTFIDGKKERKAHKQEVMDAAQKVIDYLNHVADTAFTLSKTNVDCIAGRLKDGYSVADMFTVINKKADQWLNNDNQIYLRPITLFQAKKFDNYLNEAEIGKTTRVSNIEAAGNAATKAKQLFGEIH